VSGATSIGPSSVGQPIVPRRDIVGVLQWRRLFITAHSPAIFGATLSLQAAGQRATALLGDAVVPFVAPENDIRGCAIQRISTLVHILRLGSPVTLRLVRTCHTPWDYSAIFQYESFVTDLHGVCPRSIAPDLPQFGRFEICSSTERDHSYIIPPQPAREPAIYQFHLDATRSAARLA
jgi:hypothetical protein